MDFTTLDHSSSIEKRNEFLTNFTDTSAYDFQKKLRLYPCYDGKRCNGYIWEFLKPCTLIHSKEAILLISRLNTIYVMQDMTKLRDEHRFKTIFNRNVIAKTVGNDLANYLSRKENMPPLFSLYIFDDSLKWHITITSECDEQMFHGDKHITYDCLCMTTLQL